MLYEITFTKTLTFHKEITAKSYEEAEEKAQDLADQANDGVKGYCFDADVSYETDGWEVEEIDEQE